MNIMLFLGILTFLYGSDNNQDLLHIDVRERLVNNNQIRIVVQIDNNSKREITEIDGFLLQINNKGNIITEKRITFLEATDGLLKPKQSVSKFIVFPLNQIRPDYYEFYVGKVRFQNDYRVYTYHPAIGFYRVD
ncbi:MAG: hypothetical protein QGI18_02950 [Candidatus Marinimicrobia bacterium]|nr:hypothetical protein [Candidatus Neomarinimicrobiota bacterium]